MVITVYLPFNIKHGGPYVPAVLIFFSVFILNFQSASGIGCFVCHSVNGSQPACEDRFNNSGKFYQSECYSPRKGRAGLFPATDCIKMKASRVDSTLGRPYQIIVRQCVADNGDINSETEVGRSNHCGFINQIEYDDEVVHGCIVSCNTDGCNSAQKLFIKGALFLISLTLLIIDHF